MSKFKISLCTPFINTFGDTEYKREYFSKFENQKNSYSFSYGENLRISKNAQLELQFKMNKYYQDEGEMKINPFVPKMLNGALVELVDKDDRVFQFVIKGIEYDIKSNNVVISYTAQDFFNFQHRKQNSGYSIKNESDSENFIGAANINDWVEKYIVPDCKIGYQYIPLEDGIYMGKDGETHHFIKKEDGRFWALTNDKYLKTNKTYYENDGSSFYVTYNDDGVLQFNTTGEPNTAFSQIDTSLAIGSEYFYKGLNEESSTSIFSETLFDQVFESTESATGLKEVKYFIKFPKDKEKDKDYYKPIVFSCSNSSAANALILLGEELGMMIDVDYSHRWFWFTDIKNPQYTGLSYSPKVDLNTLSLKNDGESLATIVNIQGPTIGGDIISLIPPLPAFFRYYFQTEDWKNSIWKTGLFRELCTSHIANVPLFGLENIPATKHFITFDCHNDLQLPNTCHIKIDKEQNVRYTFENGVLTTPQSEESYGSFCIEYNKVYYYNADDDKVSYYYIREDENILKEYVGFPIFIPKVYSGYDGVKLSPSSVLKFEKGSEMKTFSIFDLEDGSTDILLTYLGLKPIANATLPGGPVGTLFEKSIQDSSEYFDGKTIKGLKENEHFALKVEGNSEDGPCYFQMSYSNGDTVGNAEKEYLENGIENSIICILSSTPYATYKSDPINSIQTFYQKKSYNELGGINKFTWSILQGFLRLKLEDAIFPQDSEFIKNNILPNYENFYDQYGNIKPYIGGSAVELNDEYFEITQKGSIQNGITGYEYSDTGMWQTILVNKDLLGEDKFRWKLDAKNSFISVSFERTPSEEDLLFADIADTIPFLENKLVKVEYLRNVFSKELWTKLNDTLFNQLRINNGLLLYYTSDYLSSLSTKTQKLSQLINEVDLLGATVMTEITNNTSASFNLSPETSWQSFWSFYLNALQKENFSVREEYRNLLSTFGLTFNETEEEWTLSNSSGRQILDWKSLLTEYGQKYYNTTQRFLKNLYNFRRYWEGPIEFIAADKANWTNGQYYLQHINKEDNDPSIIEHLALIEESLTTYWNEAYSASLNSHYFLPERWQPNKPITADGEYTCSQVNIFNVILENGIINTRWVPNVVREKGVNERVFSYNEEITTPEDEQEQWMRDLDCLTWEKIELENKKTDIYKATDGEGTSWKALIEEVALLKEIDELSAESQQQQIVNKLQAYYKYFGGAYEIIFKVLKKCFSNKSMEKYNFYLQKNKEIWKELYEQYGMLLLETSFTSENATSSEILLQQALAFYKDYEKPQVQYSLSIIDFSQLQGYSTIPIRVGDQISIFAQDFYEEQDWIKQLLQERLFINEISYDLRKDANITIGVDTISYQDKLIGKLIKLIK